MFLSANIHKCNWPYSIDFLGLYYILSQIAPVVLLQMCSTVNAEPRHVRDTDLMGWYQTDWLSANLRTPVQSITLPDVQFETDSDSKY